MNKKLQSKIFRVKYLLIAALILLTGGVAEAHDISLMTLQQTRVSLNFQNKDIKVILQEVRKQANISFALNESENHEELSSLTIKVENQTVAEVLNTLLEGTSFGYTLRNNVVNITKKELAQAPQPKAIELKGRVMNIDGEPIVGATVLSTSGEGAITDDKGAFAFTLRSAGTIEVSCVGYISQAIEVTASDNDLVFSLQVDDLAVEEVVVNGLFSKKKSTFTGSEKTMSAAQLKTVGNTNLVSAIASLTPGLNIQVNNSAGSNPNVLPEFILRGTSSLQTSYDVNPNQPLIMLDGIEISLTELYDLDINDIESVTVLKDASATSLYGEKASNGIIVIERKAISVDELRLTYNFNATATVPDLNSYDYLNAAEKLEFERLAGVYNFSNAASLEEYNERVRQVAMGLDTDWMSQPLRTGLTLNNSIGVSGRTTNLQYRLTANLNSTKGVMKDDSRNSSTIGLYLSYRVKDKLQVSFQSSYNELKTVESPYGSFSQYVTLNPYDSPYDENGNYVSKLSWDVGNPLYNATVGSFTNSETSTMTNTLDLRWDVLDNLYVTAQGSMSKAKGLATYFSSPDASYFEDLTVNERGSLREDNSTSENYSGRFVVNYAKELAKDHVLSVHLGGDISKSDAISVAYTSIGYMKDDLYYPTFAYGYGDDSTPTGSTSLSTSVGAFMNANYSYKDKYFVDASLRRSGSSMFGSNNRYADFWSLGAGWNIHKEDFMQNTVFSSLRLRYSYGVTGSVEFSPYQAMTTYSYSSDYNYLKGVGAVPITMGNTDLTWQTTKQHNLGLDATLFNNRLDLTLDAYQQMTDDMLVDLTIPYSVGVSTVKDNLGRMRNIGVEFDVAAVLIQNKDWRLRLAVNGSHNKNEILEISSALASFNEANQSSRGTSPSVQYEEGESTTAIYAVRSAGINPASGQEIFITKEGKYTETYDATNKIVVGDTEPSIQGSIMPSLTYKNYSLNCTMSYRVGGQIYNSTRVANVENIDPKENVDRRAYEQRWIYPNDVAYYLYIATWEDRTGDHSTRFVEDENTLQISRIEFAYEFQRAFLDKIGIKRLRVSVGMNDVAYLSTVKYERGTSYPFNRGFSFTLSPTF